MSGKVGGAAAMRISDKEAFTVLGLPLGVDKEAITKKYKSLSIKLSGSRTLEDKKRLEQVVAAYRQLLPPLQKCTNHTRARHKGQSGAYDDCDSDDASSEKDWTVLCRNGDSRTNLSRSTADLTEEEKEQRKADKRRAKKKNRKEKKKLEKLETQILSQGGAKRDEEEECEEEEEEEEEDEDEGEEGQGLDPNSAFVAKAARRVVQGGGGRGERAPRPHTHALPRPVSREERVDHSGEVEMSLSQARQLAKRGNEAANVGQYIAAVKLFTDAINLDSTDHRFLGNRSYCFNQLGYHEKALEDAQRAIDLAPHWAKGHYRRGTALRDLGKYVDAEAAFEEVLRLDDMCREAHEEIRRVRIARIVEMGFTEQQAVNAVAKYTNVQPALDALLSGEFKEATEDVFYSDDEEEFMKRAKVSQAAKDVKMNPQNPEGLTSLWVGNVLPEVSEKSLAQLFSKQGHVTSVRLLKEKYCAFVNFSNKAAAGRAMELLQGHEFCGQKLLIKFPDNPIGPGAQSVITRKAKLHTTQPHAHTAKNTTTTTPTSGTHQNGITTNNINNHIPHPNPAALKLNGGVPGLGVAQMQDQQAKLRGPVNGDECYFWRTTGCAFGDGCKHRHIAAHRGVDRKPWQK